MIVGTTSPPNLGELETVLAERKTRLSESLRATRATLLQKLALTFQDLMLPPDLSDLIRFERVTLAAVVEITDRLAEVEGVEAGYARSLAEQTRETAEAKAAFEQADPLTQAIDRHKSLERFLVAQMEAEIYTEALSAIRQGKESAERSLHAARRRLSPACTSYITAKRAALIDEAEQVLEKAMGQVRYAENLKGRVEWVTAEFTQRYGWDPEADGQETA